jgi:tetratricopeptide (TPR) repeat protein
VAPAHRGASAWLPGVRASEEPGCHALVAAARAAGPTPVPDPVRPALLHSCRTLHAPALSSSPAVPARVGLLLLPPLPPDRSVQPSDLLAWADASAARGAGYATRGDWRGAFRSYIVAAELLGQLLADVEPSQELRDRARRRMDVVVGIAEELRQDHPRLLLLAPSQTTPEVAIASAWGELDEAAAGARAALAREENRAGNAQFKAGKNAEAVARYNAALELDAALPHAYGNRSVAFLRMDDLGSALSDARAAVDIEPEAVARRAGVPLRRGVDGCNARKAAEAGESSVSEAGSGGAAESSMAEAQRRFSQEVAKEVAELRACSIDPATIQLIECAELGDAEGLMRALGEGARIDWGNPGWLDYTALHMASLHGHIEIARLLLTAEANVSVLVRLRPALLRGCI